MSNNELHIDAYFADRAAAHEAPPDDPAGPLEAFLAAHADLPPRLSDATIFSRAGDRAVPLTLGDLRRAAAAIRGQDEEVTRLRAELAAERAAVAAACSMFSRRTWAGRLDMPRAFHVARGRVMAGLPPEPGPAGLAAGAGGGSTEGTGGGDGA